MIHWDIFDPHALHDRVHPDLLSLLFELRVPSIVIVEFFLLFILIVHVETGDDEISHENHVYCQKNCIEEKIEHIQRFLADD